MNKTQKINNLNDKELKRLFENATSYTNATALLFNIDKGYPSHYLVTQLRDKMISNGYDFSNEHRLRKIPDEEVFTKGVEWSTSFLRKRYIQLNTPYKCQICGLSNWQGHSIPLELDHIDGFPSNNEITNLRWLCPNCHSQQPTSKGANHHGRKSRGKETHCLRCGKLFTHPQREHRKFCSVECASKWRHEQASIKHNFPIEKDDLSNLIMLGNNLSEIGRKFSVSPNAVKKWCKAYGIKY